MFLKAVSSCTEQRTFAKRLKTMFCKQHFLIFCYLYVVTYRVNKCKLSPYAHTYVRVFCLSFLLGTSDSYVTLNCLSLSPHLSSLYISWIHIKKKVILCEILFFFPLGVFATDILTVINYNYITEL